MHFNFLKIFRSSLENADAAPSKLSVMLVCRQFESDSSSLSREISKRRMALNTFNSFAFPLKKISATCIA